MAHADTAPIRPGEELDAGALSAYLRGKVPGIEDGLALEQFPGGHSNLTYLLKAGAREYVLRRAPLGPVAPKAHDMAREYRVLEVVHPVFAPAPRVYWLCEDPGIIGAVFYLMERRRGVILREGADFDGDAVRAGQISRAFTDTLIDMHAIDVERHRLITLGKPDGFLERQVRGWAERWQRAKTEESAAMDRVIRWLAETMPSSPAPSLVHNDYKLDNIMLNAGDPGRVEAVLDWEMTTVGDPIADLGLTLCYWSLGSASALKGEGARALTDGPGWYSKQEIVERYASRTGRDVSRIGWYEVLGVFKLAVILQQIYFRYFKGQTRDERFSRFDARVRGLIDRAVELLERAG